MPVRFFVHCTEQRTLSGSLSVPFGRFLWLVVMPVRHGRCVLPGTGKSGAGGSFLAAGDQKSPALYCLVLVGGFYVVYLDTVLSEL